jgi:probable F420-dependent oxidoreductase
MAHIEFGVRIPNSGPLANPTNLIRAAREAEAMGFDAVWVHDHVAWNQEMHRKHVSSGAVEAVNETQTPDFFESVVTLSHIAAHTRSVRLGVACMVLPARNPVYLAKQWAVLDVFSGGRTILGVGLGSPATLASRDFEILGIPLAGRTKRMEEFAEVLRAVWLQDQATFKGQFMNFEGAEIFPKPLQRPNPPIWVGGGTDQAARRAARIGDGWVPGWRTPEEMKAGLQLIAREAERVGRKLDQFDVGLEILSSVARDRETAMRRGYATVEAGLRSYEKTFDSASEPIRRSFFGDAGDVTRQVEAFVDAGVRHFELRMIYGSMAQMFEQMELWVEDIIPQFR